MQSAASRRPARHVSWPRAIVLATVTSLGSAAAAEPTSLLQSVLYVERGSGNSVPSEMIHVTVEEDADRLRSVTRFYHPQLEPSLSSFEVRRIGPCKFAVDHREIPSVVPYVDVSYTVDFSVAQFDAVRTARIRNVYGNEILAIHIPKAQFCLISGRHYGNPGVAPGDCTDGAYVGRYIGRPDLVARMMTHIDRIAQACRALSHHDRQRRLARN